MKMFKTPRHAIVEKLQPLAFLNPLVVTKTTKRKIILLKHFKQKSVQTTFNRFTLTTIPVSILSVHRIVYVFQNDPWIKPKKIPVTYYFLTICNLHTSIHSHLLKCIVCIWLPLLTQITLREIPSNMQSDKLNFSLISFCLWKTTKCKPNVQQ